MKADWESFAIGEAKRYGLDPDIVTRLIQTESSWNPNAGSSKGARGLMQLTPITAKEMGYDEVPMDPIENIRAGIGYLSKLHKRFGDYPKALAAYNWGPTNVAKHGLDAMPAETRGHQQKILGTDYGLQAKGQTPATQVSAKMTPEQMLKAYTDSLGKNDIAAPPPDMPPAVPTEMAQDTAGVLGKGILPTSNEELARVAAADTNPVSAAIGGAMRGVTGAAGDLAAWGIGKLRGEPPAEPNFLQRAAQPVPAPDYVPQGLQSVNEGAASLGKGIALGAAGTGLAGGLLRTGSNLPRIGPLMEAAGNAISSGGMLTGLKPAGAWQQIGNALLRVGGGATSGVIADKAIDPNSNTGALAAGIGAVIPGAAMAGRGLGKTAGAVFRPLVNPGATAERAALGAIDDPVAALARLQQGGQGLATPSVYEMINQPRLNSLVREMRSSTGDNTFALRLAAQRAAQDAQREAALQGMGGTRAAVQAARDARSAATDPLYDQLRRQYGGTPVSLQGLSQVRLGMRKAGEDISSPAVVGALDDFGSVLRTALKTPGATIGRNARGDFSLANSSIRLNDALALQQNARGLVRGARANAPVAAPMSADDAAVIRNIPRLSDALQRAMGRITTLADDASKAYAAASVPVKANTVFTRVVEHIRNATGTMDPATEQVVERFSIPKLANTLRDIRPDDWKAMTSTQQNALKTLLGELQRAEAALAPTGGLSGVARDVLGGGLSPAQRLVMAKMSGGMAGPVLNTVMEATGVPQRVGGKLADTLISDPRLLTEALQRQLNPAPYVSGPGSSLLHMGRQALPVAPASLLYSQQ